MARLSLLLSMLLLAACGTYTYPASAEADGMTAAELAEGDPDEMICEQKKVAGSIIRKRVCMTRAERVMLAEESENAAREVQNQSLRSCAAGSSCGM